MQYEVVGLFVAAVSNGFLSLIVLRGRRDLVAVIFSLFSLSAALWAFFLGFFILTENLFHALKYANLYYYAAAAVPISLIFFAIHFQEKAKFNIFHLVLLLPWILISFAFLLDDHFIIQKIFIGENGTKDVILNKPNYILYAIYFGFYSFTTYAIIISKLIKTKGRRNKNRLMLVAGGVLLSYLFGMYYNLVLPFMGNYQLIWVGPLFSIFMITAVGVAIFRYKLFNIKVIATQMFVGILILFLLTQTIASTTREDLIINTVLLIFSSFFGLFLVRSVSKEVEAREHIEKLAKDLRSANEKLHKISALKTEFVSVATHQLRSPLTAIKGYSSMMLDGSYGEIPEQMKLPVERIHTSTVSLAQVVQDFLDISRIEQGSVKYEMVAFDFAELVNEVINEMSPNIEKSSLSFSYSVEGRDEFSEEGKRSALYVLRGDRLKLKQVVGNMIDNALKYTQSGFVNVNLSQTKDRIRFEVRDSGMGMSEKTIGSLFQKFERADGADKVNVSGTGLGLYIAREIVETHKGKIWAESKGLGKGSAFIIELNK